MTTVAWLGTDGVVHFVKCPTMVDAVAVAKALPGYKDAVGAWIT